MTTMARLKALLVALLLAGTALGSRDVGGISITVVTESEQERLQLAKQLVVMLFSSDDAQDEHRVGSAILVGMDPHCLYAATANHIVRPAAQPTGMELWVGTQTHGDKLTRVRVLPQHDTELDLAVICIPDPQRLFVPMPRLPFYLRGSPAELKGGDRMTFLGHGDALPWHLPTGNVTFGSKEGDILRFRGGELQPGDSGGGLFNHDAVFYELVGLILRRYEGHAEALTIDAIERKFSDWRLPVAWFDWDFRNAEAFGHSLHWQTTTRIGGDAPPQQPLDRERLQKLAVRVMGGPAGRNNGLLVGTHGPIGYVAVPWARNEWVPETPLSVTFHGGYTTTAQFAVDGIEAGPSLLAISMDAAEMTALGLRFSDVPGSVPRFAVPPSSPLRVAAIDATQISLGSSAFLVGTNEAGTWEILPRDLVVVRKSDRDVILSGGAVSRQSLGWLALDDRNRLMGLVTSVGDAELTVRLTQSWLHQLPLPAEAQTLQPWSTLNIPVPALVDGMRLASPSGCEASRLMAYGLNDHTEDVLPLDAGVAITGLTNMWHWSDTESFWLHLDEHAKVMAVGRALVAGQKSRQHLMLAGNRANMLLLGQVRTNDAGRAARGAEARWCGFIQSKTIASTGGAEPARVLCDGPATVLPKAVATREARHVVSGRVQGADSSSKPVLALLAEDGSSRILSQGAASTVHSDLQVGANGDIYVAGYTVSNDSRSEDVWIAKYGKEGNPLWQYTEPQVRSHEQARAVAVLSDGAVIVAGVASSHEKLARRLRVWKLSTEGQLLWKRDFGGSTLADAEDLIANAQGGAIIAGNVTWQDRLPNGSTDGWLLSIDANGAILWQHTFSERYAAFGRNASFKRLIQTPTGYFILGDMSPSFMGASGLWLLQLNESGQVVRGSC